MKKLKYMAALAAVVMLSGCVSAANGGGEELTDEEKAEVQSAVEDAGNALEEATQGTSLNDVLRTIEKEINEQVGEINWADMFFSNYDPENGKRLRFIKANDIEDPDSSDGTVIEDETDFINGLNADEWEIIDSIAESAPEAVYVIEQEGTKRLFGGTKYDEIGRLTLYEGNKATLEALTGVLIGNDDDSDEWLTSCYSIPEETAEFLRNQGNETINS